VSVQAVTGVGLIFALNPIGTGFGALGPLIPMAYILTRMATGHRPRRITFEARYPEIATLSRTGRRRRGVDILTRAKKKLHVTIGTEEKRDEWLEQVKEIASEQHPEVTVHDDGETVRIVPRRVNSQS